MSIVARIVRVGASIGLAGAVLAAAPGPAPANDIPPPVDSSSGKVGSHRLVDSTESPGATCKYGYEIDLTDYYNGLRTVSVGPPVAFARRGKATQRISWRVIVEVWVSPDWVPYRVTAWQSRVASPTQAAPFTARDVPTDPWGDGVHGSVLRARVQLRWHAPDDGDVVGRATLYPRHYRMIEGALSTPLEDRCPSTTG